MAVAIIEIQKMLGVMTSIIIFGGKYFAKKGRS